MQLPFQPIAGRFDEPVYIVGGGPSLKGFDFSRIRGAGYLLGCNKSAWWAGCDGLFTLDQHFARMHRKDIADFVSYGRDAWLAMPVNDDRHDPIPGAHYVIRDRGKGLSDDPRYIYGVNSGFGALGLAYMMQAPSIALLGLDMQYGKDGSTHAHEGYSWHNPKAHRWMCRFWSKAFDQAAQQCAAAGIEVINYVGPQGSAITAFPTAPLDDL